jgi:glutathione S-transferase
LWSSRSPFARKVTIAAHELGIIDRITLERVVVKADDPNRAVFAVNPLGKIPALTLDDGTVLYDSVVIVEYLDATFGGSLIPGSGPERWAALKLQALADGLMEADLRWMEERNRPETERRMGHLNGMRTKVDAALATLEAMTFSGVTVGTIATGGALAHLDFRFPDVPWRPNHPRLAAWFEEFSARPSMHATQFVDQY